MILRRLRRRSGAALTAGAKNAARSDVDIAAAIDALRPQRALDSAVAASRLRRCGVLAAIRCGWKKKRLGLMTEVSMTDLSLPDLAQEAAIKPDADVASSQFFLPTSCVTMARRFRALRRGTNLALVGVANCVKKCSRHCGKALLASSNNARCERGCFGRRTTWASSTFSEKNVARRRSAPLMTLTDLLRCGPKYGSKNAVQRQLRPQRENMVAHIRGCGTSRPEAQRILDQRRAAQI